MKRSTITKKKTKRTSDYDREFEKMKPIIRARSRGRCEAVRVATTYVTLVAEEDRNRALLCLDVFKDWHEENCSGRATHVHHRKYRNKARGGTNAESNLADLSTVCHDWAHSHTVLSNPIGLTLKAHESEAL
jgi:hypothetical protein